MQTDATATSFEGEAARAMRLTRERAMLDVAQADIAAGRVYTDEELEAWWDKLEAAGEEH